MADVLEAIDLTNTNHDSDDFAELRRAVLEELSSYDNIRVGATSIKGVTTIVGQHGNRWYHVVRIKGCSKAQSHTYASLLASDARKLAIQRVNSKLEMSAKRSAIRQRVNASKPPKVYYQPRNQI